MGRSLLLAYLVAVVFSGRQQFDAPFPTTSCTGLHLSALGRAIIGRFRLTLAETIRLAGLTLRDPGRTIAETEGRTRWAGKRGVPCRSYRQAGDQHLLAQLAGAR